MSLALIEWVGQINGSELTHPEFRVLFRLCWHTNQHTLLCCPSVEDLAEKCQMKPRSVYRAIASLEEKKFIAVHRERWPNGTQKVNRYTVLADIEMTMPGGRKVRIKADEEDAKSRVTEMTLANPEPGDTGDNSRVTQESPYKRGSIKEEVVESPLSTNVDRHPPQEGNGNLPAIVQSGLPEKVMKSWNALAEREKGISGFRLLTPDRKTKIEKRARDVAKQIGGTPDGIWAEIFRQIDASRFLRGLAAPGKDRDRPFQLDIDWILIPKNFSKTLEGRYNDELNAGRVRDINPHTGRTLGPGQQATLNVFNSIRSNEARRRG